MDNILNRYQNKHIYCRIALFYFYVRVNSLDLFINAPLQAPDLGGNFFSSLSLWQYRGVVLLFLFMSSLFFWVESFIG